MKTSHVQHWAFRRHIVTAVMSILPCRAQLTRPPPCCAACCVCSIITTSAFVAARVKHRPLQTGGFSAESSVITHTVSLLAIPSERGAEADRHTMFHVHAGSAGRRPRAGRAGRAAVRRPFPSRGRHLGRHDRPRLCRSVLGRGLCSRCCYCIQCHCGFRLPVTCSSAS